MGKFLRFRLNRNRLRLILIILSILFSASSLAQQVILVLLPTDYQQSIHARLWAFDNKQLLISDIPVTIGKQGATKQKREGDNKTPIGVFSIKSAFGFSKTSLNPHFPYLWIHQGTEAVDDVNSGFYNQIIDANQVTKKDWNSSEKMWKIPQYRMGLVIAYNPSNQKGNGSNIFMHSWLNRDAATAGCIAMSTTHLEKLIGWLNVNKHPIIVITAGGT